jgi:hypothetical protein
MRQGRDYASLTWYTPSPKNPAVPSCSVTPCPLLPLLPSAVISLANAID